MAYDAPATDRSAALEAALRTLYLTMLARPVPARFLALVDELEAEGADARV